MYARIATLWDIRNTDDLDPVVKLLVESLASEVFGLSGELDTIEDRIVEKLARAFTPSSMMAASPAHAILHARGVGEDARVFTNTEFVYKEPRFLQRHLLQKLSMSPVCEVPIFDAEVVSFIAENRFYSVTPKGGKEHIAGSTGRNPIFNNTVWVGMETGAGLHNLRNMSFWFEFPLMDDPYEYRRLIEYGKWSHDGKSLSTVAGLPEVTGDYRKELFELYDQQTFLRNEVKGKYTNQFISINQDMPAKELKKERIPAELAHLFDTAFLGELSDDVVWFKVVLPPAFDTNGLNNLAVHINCFPVANIYRKQLLTTISPLSSIVRLEKDQNEYFLFVESIHNSVGNEYKQVRTHSDNKDSFSYVIRRGGSERFSSLDAKDFLERLLDIYRSESIAFSAIDRNITDTSEKMMEYLSDFERKLHSYGGNNEHTSYLILGGEVEERIGLTVHYNMTNGDIANDIKAAETLSVPQASDVATSSSFLMTATRGGSKSPSESSQREIYQYMLTSRDRIYTREDIKLFCRCYFGEHFTDVDVKNGYEVSNKPGEGIVRTTIVTLKGVNGKSVGESGLFQNDVLLGLQRRSPESTNYRIVLE